jgi:hypothetical protein
MNVKPGNPAMMSNVSSRQTRRFQARRECGPD